MYAAAIHLSGSGTPPRPHGRVQRCERQEEIVIEAPMEEDDTLEGACVPQQPAAHAASMPLPVVDVDAHLPRPAGVALPALLSSSSLHSRDSSFDASCFDPVASALGTTTPPRVEQRRTKGSATRAEEHTKSPEATTKLPEGTSAGLPPIDRRAMHSASVTNSRAASPAIGTKNKDRRMSLRQEMTPPSPLLRADSFLQRSIDRLAQKLDSDTTSFALSNTRAAISPVLAAGETIVANTRSAPSPLLKSRLISSGKTSPDVQSISIRSRAGSATAEIDPAKALVEWSLDSSPIERPADPRRKSLVERTPEGENRSIAEIVDALTPGMRRASINASDIRTAAQADLDANAHQDSSKMNFSRTIGLNRSRRNSATSVTLEPLRSSTPFPQVAAGENTNGGLIDLEEEENQAKKNRRMAMMNPTPAAVGEEPSPLNLNLASLNRRSTLPATMGLTPSSSFQAFRSTSCNVEEPAVQSRSESRSRNEPLFPPSSSSSSSVCFQPYRSPFSSGLSDPDQQRSPPRRQKEALTPEAMREIQAQLLEHANPATEFLLAL